MYDPNFKHLFYEKARKIIDEKGEQLTYADFSTIDIIHPGLHDGIREFFEEFPFPQGSKALEIGSGLGCTARYMHANYGVEVHGVEYLEHFVECCTFLNQVLGFQDNIHIQHADVVTWEAPENTFDLAVSCVCFMFIPDPAGLRNVAKALKPGGLFFFEDYFYVKPRDQWDANDHHNIEARGMCGVRFQEELCQIMEDAGMEVAKVIECGRYWSENSWQRGQDLYNQGFSEDTGIGSPIHQYAIVSPQLKCDLDHLTVDEIKRRYPNVSKNFDVEDLVFRKPRLTTGRRIIFRKRSS